MCQDKVKSISSLQVSRLANPWSHRSDPVGSEQALQTNAITPRDLNELFGDYVSIVKSGRLLYLRSYGDASSISQADVSSSSKFDDLKWVS